MTCTNLDEFQKAWQSQGGTSLNADQLAQALQRHDQSFNRMIFWRDVREIGVALVLIPVWIALGIGMSLPRTWYLAIPGLMWVAGYMFVDRRRQQRAAPGAGASLRSAMQYSLGQVEHQIWLLRNVAWWYLLPLAIPMLAFVAEIGAQAEPPAWFAGLMTTFVAAVIVGALGFVYWVNQHAVRTHLEPLREQLHAALAGLSDDNVGTT
ncbi:MAG: hypothetical protein U0992_19455 [Planctomycetaceae bacterium]